jgi:hypothetical protein
MQTIRCLPNDAQPTVFGLKAVTDGLLDDFELVLVKG